MSNIAVKPLLMLRKRCYSVVREGLRFSAATKMVKTTVISELASVANNEGIIFWMRDPKSGNWIPENHFGEVDAAELRDKFLPKRTQNL